MKPERLPPWAIDSQLRAESRPAGDMIGLPGTALNVVASRKKRRIFRRSRMDVLFTIVCQSSKRKPLRK